MTSRWGTVGDGPGDDVGVRKGAGAGAGAPSSDTPLTAITSRPIRQAISTFTPGLPLAIAYSGGADSTALLAACVAKWPGQVRAIHIHHGLQEAADSFEQTCVNVCRQLDVLLAVKRVNARHAPGESPEDAARKARYGAFVQVLRDDWQGKVKDIALAQHADDQVETLLLALSRGAGLPGLAAMAATWQRGGITWHRPLLCVPSPEIRAWVQAENLLWVDDPTNVDEQFTRNRIRARLLPALQEAFPQFRDTFARSARHAAQAQEMLMEVAAQDLEATGNPPRLKALQALSRARQANVLRYWLKAAHATSPSAAQLNELLGQVQACTTRGHDLNIKVGQGFVKRNGDALAFA
ncbi:MAG: tRNA lysidine(34) synthetase TilS [Comamonadaceae bacterium]|nr:MAG: tRNA lysidine(34) synthetase TilS [Comamonadaceae bacterium]